MTAAVLTLPAEYYVADRDGLLRSPAVCQRAGCTYRQLDFWVRCGYLHPARAATGSGSQRLFTEAEAAVAARLTRLVDAGLLPAAAAKVARSGGDVWLSSYVLVTVI